MVLRRAGRAWIGGCGICLRGRRGGRILAGRRWGDWGSGCGRCVAEVMISIMGKGVIGSNFLSRVKGVWFRAWHRTYNRVADVIAVLAGACNQSMWDGEGYSGGYASWRCMRGRGHVGAHRSINYVWDAPGHRARYEPLQFEGPLVYMDLVARELPFRSVTQHRFLTESRRRERQRRAAVERRFAEQRAARGG